MKIYIASSFDLALRCEEIRQMLAQNGHEVQDVWWNVKTKDDFKNSSEQDFYGSALVQSIEARHWKAIRECDLLILVSGPHNEQRSFTGANVEVGYAIASGIPVVSIGGIKRSAMYCSIIRCIDNKELRQVVQCIAMEAR